MKNYQVFLILLLCISLTSCKTTIANPGKPLIESSIEVGRTYEVQDFNAKVFNLKITDFDKDCIYGISSKNTQIIIDRSSIRQMKKMGSIKIYHSRCFGSSSSYFRSNLRSSKCIFLFSNE